ncbi:MAG: flagellar biosynthesis regulator FlaF [Rhodospirillales bacterium]|nr:flagellar biosynthesis regulator FlaF [Rhodospirillales bacterium]
MSNNQKPGQSKPSNPYAAAAGAYDTHAQKHTPDQRETEARVLLKAAKAFQDIQKRWDQISREDLDECLKYNRQIWMMFVDTAIEDEGGERPVELRNNIANLGVFIFNHTLEVLADPQPQKLDILIEINREIAAGLMTRPKPEGQTQAAPTDTVDQA